MKVKIYGYQNETGKIVHYNQNLLNDDPCAQETTVEIPDDLNPYESVSGDICIDCHGGKWMLNEILFCKNGNPGIKYCDMDTGKDIKQMLKVIGAKWV